MRSHGTETSAADFWPCSTGFESPGNFLFLFYMKLRFICSMKFELSCHDWWLGSGICMSANTTKYAIREISMIEKLLYSLYFTEFIVHYEDSLIQLEESSLHWLSGVFFFIIIFNIQEVPPRSKAVGQMCWLLQLYYIAIRMNVGIMPWSSGFNMFVQL